MIDLQKFCGDEDSRVSSPFTKGDWTYATNGHILVRVPAMAEYTAKGVNAEALFEKAMARKPNLVPFECPDLPERTTASEECKECDGTGLQHDCPACTCKCEECDDGNVETDSDENISVQIGAAYYDIRYIRLLAGLRSVKIAEHPPEREALLFSFGGGNGLLMPLSHAREENIKA